MASNAIVDIFRVKDLRDRIFFTLFWLLIFRLGCFITLPAVDISAIQRALEQTGGIADCRHLQG